ncbi:hypothetical protein HKD37_04G010166 [Glycine soja]
MLLFSFSLHSSSPTFKLLSMASYGGILEVVSNPWRFILVNWFCDTDLVNPTGIDRVLIEKDFLADSYSDLEASILEEK